MRAPRNDPHDETRITIRFPREVAEHLKLLARKNNRSLNGEMVQAAQEYITHHQQQKSQEHPNGKAI